MTSEFKPKQVEDGAQVTGSSSVGPLSSSNLGIFSFDANIVSSVKFEFRLSEDVTRIVINSSGIITDVIVSEGNKSTGTPPSWAEGILCLVTPHEKLDAVLGDFSELYQKNINRYGAKRARYIYTIQVLRSAGPLIWTGLKRAALLLIGWKLTG